MPYFLNRSSRDRLTALALLMACFIGFNANLRSIPAVDTYAARLLPFSMLEHGTLSLDPIAERVTKGRADFANLIREGRDGRAYSRYPVALPIVASPLYVLPSLWLNGQDQPPQARERLARIMEKLVASLIAALSVAILYLALRRRCGPAMATGLALTYAFGTTTWTISAQALWQHGLTQLVLALALVLVSGKASQGRAIALGLCLGLAVAARPADVLLAGPLALYGLWWAGGARWGLVLAGLVPSGLTLGYNLLVLGDLIGGYASSHNDKNLSPSLLEGFAALLVSPARGLLVFSPFLAFLAFGIGKVLDDRPYRSLSLTILGACLLQLAFYGYVDWRQGESWGPRWQTDMLPLLFFLLPPLLQSQGRAARALFISACALAMLSQAVGAFWYNGSSYAKLFDEARQSGNKTAAFWNPAHYPVLMELSHKRAPADLLNEALGYVDQARVEIGATGPVIRVNGWTLVNGRTPSRIIVLANGVALGEARQFEDRPDVVKATGKRQKSGWQVTIPANDIADGPIRITVLADATTEPWFIGQKTISQQDRLIEANPAQTARAMLVAGQQPQGFWLTSHTTSTLFRDPKAEMNTYLNAMIIDMAEPLMADPILAKAIGKAREFLSRQIEADGLVRYHGRPDAPWIGTLGCAITPDSDDTALAWRLAPPEGRTPAAALKAISAYRRDDGLYRTWLAAPRDYRCLDPGTDPNPADLTIQGHIYLWLAQADAAKAKALCKAMRKAPDEDGLWRYYQTAPLIPRLRQADLARAGCALKLPDARLQTTIGGQRLWLRMAELLNEFGSGQRSPAMVTEARELLARAADNSFARIRQTPPLLYQNDQTATVTRFYWSSDFGLVLWLRLHAALETIAGKTP